MAESCPEAGERRVAALWQAGLSPPEHKIGISVLGKPGIGTRERGN